MSARRMFNTILLANVAMMLTIIFPQGLWAGPPVKLNGPLVSGGSVIDIPSFTPDGSRVIYVADQITNDVFELFSVPSDGGIPIKLNGALATSRDVGHVPLTRSPLVSSDGSHVYYQVVGEITAGGLGLYSVPSDGGTPMILNAPLSSADLIGFRGVSGDGSRILYEIYTDGPNADFSNLYSAPNGGGSAVKLNASVSGTFIGSAGFTPDGVRVVFNVYAVSRSGADTRSTLYSIPRDGGSPIQLAESAEGDPTVRVSSDSSRVLYKTSELYSVPTVGGTLVKLSDPMVLGGNVRDARFGPDGSRAFYLADQVTDEVIELFGVPSDRGPVVKLNGALPSGGDVVSTSIEVSSDGSRVLYVADQDTDNVFELYSVSSFGGTPVKLNGPLVAGGDTTFYTYTSPIFSPDGSRVIYRADQDTDNVFELYSVSSLGGTPIKLNGPLVAGGDVSGNSSFQSTNTFKTSHNGSRVLYAADQDTDGVNELYSVPSGGGAPVKINGPLAIGANILGGSLSSDVLFDFDYSADDSRVLFTIVQSNTREIYSRIVRERWNASSGDWDAAENWNFGETPDEVMQIAIDAAAIVTASGNATQRSVNELHLGSGTGTSTLMLDADAAITAINGVVIEANGVLAGNGSIIGDLANSGLVSPGASPGALHVDGDYSQSADGSLLVQLAGASSFDKLLMTGTAVLGGMLDLSLVDFTPVAGNTFEILAASGGLSGRFASTQLPNLPNGLRFDVRYEPTSVKLAVVGVPEPSTFILAAFVIIPFAGRLKRRGQAITKAIQ